MPTLAFMLPAMAKGPSPETAHMRRAHGAILGRLELTIYAIAYVIAFELSKLATSGRRARRATAARLARSRSAEVEGTEAHLSRF